MTDILETIWRVHNDPGAGHEAELATTDLDFAAGQQLQLALLERWLDNDMVLGGWKIGMTSGANRNGMGDGIRPFGFILKERIVASGETLELATLHRGQIENELCFLMGQDLGPDATRESAQAAVAGVLPAFEINQKRLAQGAGPGLRVADNLSNWGIVIGSPGEPQVDYQNMTVTLKQAQTDAVIERVASKKHIDDHYDSLATLARTLAEYGQTLSAGQYVITGAYGKTPFAAGHYAGHFDSGVGDVEIILA